MVLDMASGAGGQRERTGAAQPQSTTSMPRINHAAVILEGKPGCLCVLIAHGGSRTPTSQTPPSKALAGQSIAPRAVMGQRASTRSFR